jgi:hypothetical protein
MRNRNIFRMGRKKRNTLMYVIVSGSLLLLSSLGIGQRKRLKRLMEPFNLYVSNNLFRRMKKNNAPIVLKNEVE